MALVPGNQPALPPLPRGGSALRLTGLTLDGKQATVKRIAKLPATEWDRDELDETDDSTGRMVSAKKEAVLTLTLLKPLYAPPEGSPSPRRLVIYGRGTGSLPTGAQWLGDSERGIRPWVWHAPDPVTGSSSTVTVTLPPLSARLTLLSGLLI